MSTEFPDLPPAEQAKRCRALAEDARREAAGAKGSLRESYLITAKRFEQLAVDAEAGSKTRLGSQSERAGETFVADYC